MSAVNDIILNNGELVPVAHTFKPTMVGDNRVVYTDPLDNSGAQDILFGRDTITLGNRPLTSVNGNYKSSVKIRIPVTIADQTTGEVSLLHTLTCNMDFIVPGASTDADILNLLTYAKKVLSNPQVEDLVTSMALPY